MAQEIVLILALWIGLFLDFLLADPTWLPHPIVGFGKLIGFGEKWLNNGKFRLIKGLLLSLSLTAGVFSGVYFFEQWLFSVNIWLGMLFNALCVFYGVASEGLIREGKAIFEILHTKGLEAGRAQLSRIVGRETHQLSAQQIRTATLESMSENLSDGVVAPLFYYALFGAPGIMAYKMSNTQDSMIGYKNERYFEFGKSAARIDDVLNFLPARLTVVLMAVANLNFNAIVFAKKYGRQHSSPNAGYPEAALAGILNCRFGGPNWYHGQLVEKPYIGEFERLIKEKDIQVALRTNYLTSVLLCLLISILWLIF